MRRSLLVLVAVAGLGGLTAGCGDDEPEPYDVTLQPTSIPSAPIAALTIERSANGTTVQASVGQQLLVRLAKDPGSSDEWTIVNDDGGILIADGGPISEGNTTVWPFRATERGDTALQFAYGPANEPPTDPEPTFLVNVRVG